VIGFIASHFFAIESFFLNSLPIPSLSRIPSYESLFIASDDLLYDFVSSICGLGIESISFLQHTQFGFVSSDPIKCFLLWICTNFEYFGPSFELWKAIRAHLSLTVILDELSPCVHSHYFRPRPEGPFDGMIAHLTGKHGGDVRVCGIVAISVKSIC
jgi:hypothetical protein